MQLPTSRWKSIENKVRIKFKKANTAEEPLFLLSKTIKIQPSQHSIFPLTFSIKKHIFAQR